MLKVNKNAEPKFFAEFKRKNKTESWKDFDFKIYSNPFKIELLKII